MWNSPLKNISDWLSSNRTRRCRALLKSAPELLETRNLLTGFAWADATNLSISFAADGTDVAGNKNELSADLNQLGTQAQWQAAIVRGFRTWLNELGYNIHVVKDSGAKFGISGASHNDARFGDVRVAAVPLTAGVLATAVPRNTFISGTWAGEMMLNTNVELKSLDELYALSLHEAGHILGLEHSTDPHSPMFDHAGTQILKPTAHDIKLLRSLYGLTRGNVFAVEHEDETNGQSEDAEEFAVVQPQGIFPRFQVTGSFQNASDVDNYVFRPRIATSESPLITTVVLRMKTTRRVPGLTILDSSGKPLEFRVIANGNGLVVLQTSEAEPDEDYTVRVHATGGKSGVMTGKYELAVTFSENSQKIETMARGVLDQKLPGKSYDLYSAKSQLVNFLLDTRESDPTANSTAVILSVYDTRNQLVFRAVTRPGEIASDDTVMLGAGKYRVRVDLLAPNKMSISEVEYSVSVAILTTDAGPLPNNPVDNPATVLNGTYPYVFPDNVTTNRPVVFKPPAVPKPPVTAGTGNKPVKPKPLPTLTWQKLVLSHPWLSGT